MFTSCLQCLQDVYNIYKMFTIFTRCLQCLQVVYNVPGQIELNKITWIHTYKNIQILSTIKIIYYVKMKSITDYEFFTYK